MPGSKPPGVSLFHLLGLFDLYLTEQNKSRLFVLLAVNIIFVESSTFDPYICLGTHGSGAGSKKDPSAAGKCRVHPFRLNMAY
jgi:hypothetical protein